MQQGLPSRLMDRLLPAGSKITLYTGAEKVNVLTWIPIDPDDPTLDKIWTPIEPL